MPADRAPARRQRHELVDPGGSGAHTLEQSEALEHALTRRLEQHARADRLELGRALEDSDVVSRLRQQCRGR